MTRKTARSSKFFSHAKTLFPGGVNSPVRGFGGVGGEPFFVARGSGAYLFDEDENRYVDFINSWGPLVLGHAHPDVVAAIAQQAAEGTSYGAPSVREIELAEKIRGHFPSIEKIRFVSSGTEAGLSVVRLARGFTKRSLILKFRGCYHGHADSLLVAAGSGVATFALPDSPGVLAPLAAATVVVDYNDLDGVRELVARRGAELAAIITEPVVGNAGFIAPLPGFLEGLREECDKCGALLIFDEVMTGFRVALGGAQGLYGVAPDLTMLGKVIGGGLPVGAFGGRGDVMDLIAPAGPVYQAGTLSGNPLAMRAGFVTLGIWESEGVFAATQEATTKFVSELLEMAQEFEIPFTAAAVGTMFGFFFRSEAVRSYGDAMASDVGMFRRFFNGCLARGVYFAPSAFEAGFISSAHIGAPLDDAAAVVREVFAELKQS